MTNSNGGSLVNDSTQGRRVPGASGLRPGQLFVENLKVVQEFHPVLLFGTQGSGKTHVLLSLLAYARYQSSMGVQTEFGCSSERDIFPVDYVAASGISHTERFINAKKMYDDEVQTFENGLDTAGTGIRDPFFIPINLIKGSEKTKLLFAEANGEWYQRGDDGLHKSFKEEINYMLLYYDKPMSIIFVVPSKQFELISLHMHLSRALERPVRIPPQSLRTPDLELKANHLQPQGQPQLPAHSLACLMLSTI
jgi:hypothetical protein